MFWGSKKSDDDKAAVKPPAPQEKSATTSANRTVVPGTQTQQRIGGRPQTSIGKKPVARDELPQFLVTEGHISEEDVRYALKMQQETGEFFGEILAKEGVLGNQSLVSFLAKNCKIPHIGLLDYMIDKSLVALIPEELCWKYHLLAVDKMGKNLTIAMVNPLNNAALDAVGKICPDLRIKPILCSHEHFEKVAAKVFGENGEHDDNTWSEIPVAESMDIPEAESALEESVETPEASLTPAASASLPEPVNRIDSDRLLESVFGAVKAPGVVDKEEKEYPLTSSEVCTLESVMRSYTDAMVNSMHDTYELLARKISFFNGVSPEDVAKIFTQGNVVEYEPAQILFNKGDSGDTMFVILNGRVKIRDGAKQIATLHSGDIFGEMALVSSSPRSATAVTMTQSDLLALSFKDILHNIPSNVAAQLLVNIIVTLAERLRAANQTEND